MANVNDTKFWTGLIKKLATIVLKSLGGKNTRRKTHNQHVVPHEDGWAVRGEGNERLTATYDHQDDAIKRAKDIAENYHSDVIIHRKDGTIRDRRSY